MKVYPLYNYYGNDEVYHMIEMNDDDILSVPIKPLGYNLDLEDLAEQVESYEIDESKKFVDIKSSQIISDLELRFNRWSNKTIVEIYNQLEFDIIVNVNNDYSFTIDPKYFDGLYNYYIDCNKYQYIFLFLALQVDYFFV